MDMVIYPGDPTTPNIASTANAPRVNHNDAENLLKIPVLPISYGDAMPLLKDIAGPVAPKDWAGALPITYHIGPSKSKVHLKLAFDWKLIGTTALTSAFGYLLKNLFTNSTGQTFKKEA
jgi:N-acetylated-alpha-linked acidic dipeptidase